MKKGDSIHVPGAESGWDLWLPLSLCIVAVCLAAMMTWSSWTGAGIIGCGPESGCAAVTGGRWAYLFGVPVSLLALVLYAMTIAAMLRQARPLGLLPLRLLSHFLSSSAGCLIGAALWFTSLQLAVIGQWCPYCVATHLCGAGAGLLLLRGARSRLASIPIPSRPSIANAAPQVVLAGANHRERLTSSHRHVSTAGSRQSSRAQAWNVWASFAAGLSATVFLAAGQILRPPTSHQVIAAAPGLLALNSQAGQDLPRAPSDAATSAHDPQKSSVLPQATRWLSLHDGSLTIDLDDVPMIGSRHAARVAVHLYDYTCQHCRLLHPMLAQTTRRWSNELATVSLPTPLDARCNPLVKRPLAEHTNACDIARLALAVWSADPQQFESFDDWIFSLKPAPTPGPVRAEAERRIGRSALDQALQSTNLQRHLDLAFRLYHTNYLRFRKGALPQILAGTNLIAGAVRDSNLLQRLLGPLPGPVPSL